MLSTKVWPIQCTRNDQNRPCFYTKRIKTTLDNIFSRPLPSPNPSFSHRNNVTQSGKKRRAFFSSPPPPPTEKRREERGEKKPALPLFQFFQPTESFQNTAEWSGRRSDGAAAKKPGYSFPSLRCVARIRHVGKTIF